MRANGAAWAAVRTAAIAAFVNRSTPYAGGDLAVLENPTEEILDGHRRGRPVRLHQTAAPGQVKKPLRRLEENYLYSSRYFDSAGGAGTVLAAGEFRFFQNAAGQPANGDGFPAGYGNLSDLETNMDVGGQIAQGKNFAFRQVGISFNSAARTADIATMLDCASLRFSKQGDQYVMRHGPARLWTGGTGISGFSTQTATEAAHNGVADPRAVRALRVPRVIKQKESFAYILNIPRLTSPANPVGTFALGAGRSIVMTIWLWGGQMDRIPG